MLTYNEKKYFLEVLEVAPGRAVSLIDTNINLDFAPPLTGEIKPMESAPVVAADDKKEEVRTLLLEVASGLLTCGSSYSLERHWEN